MNLNATQPICGILPDFPGLAFSTQPSPKVFCSVRRGQIFNENLNAQRPTRGDSKARNILFLNPNDHSS